MTTVHISRKATVPDAVRLARYRRAPELGPKVLFFSGGTALRDLSRKLIDYTHNSIHIITPFDSGGSSAKLRQSFNMLAVGDLRNRLMALAERTVSGNTETFELFSYRLPMDADDKFLKEELKSMNMGTHKLVSRIPDPMRKLIRSHLGFFRSNMPDDFDLRGASIGNLILAGGYFNYGRHIDPVIYLFSKLVEVRGTVRPVVSKDLHLTAELEDGRVLIGQHLLTGKEVEPLDSTIQRLLLSDSSEELKPAEPVIRNKVRGLIKDAELICYPMGSFYTSIIANLLPRGVGRTISETDCPKIYIPNSGHDPEQFGMSLFGSVRTLVGYLQRNCKEEIPRDRLLNFILIDSKKGNYPKPLEMEKIKRFGIEVIDTELITPDSAPYLDEERVIQSLLSLV